MITTTDCRSIAGIVSRAAVAIAAMFCLPIASRAQEVAFQFNVIDAAGQGFAKEVSAWPEASRRYAAPHYFLA
jgi:hypothetical protein